MVKNERYVEIPTHTSSTTFMKNRRIFGAGLVIIVLGLFLAIVPMIVAALTQLVDIKSIIADGYPS